MKRFLLWLDAELGTVYWRAMTILLTLFCLGSAWAAWRIVQELSGWKMWVALSLAVAMCALCGVGARHKGRKRRLSEIEP